MPETDPPDTRHPGLPPPNCSWRDWHIPLSRGDATLRQALDSARHIAATPTDVPLIVRLVENPKFSLPGLTLFNGAVDLHAHDCIHILLGRGLMSKDEAFTIGFTMGSTRRVTTSEIRLYSLTAKYLYPNPYKFDDEDLNIFAAAVHLGHVSDCQPLDQIDFDPYMDYDIARLRAHLGIEPDLLQAYYRIEQRRYPRDPASRRLLP